MQFFIPGIAPAEAETVYQGFAKALKSQFRLPIHERRIRSLKYLNSKTRWHAAVGELEEQEGKYLIMAIFESKSYIVYTQAPDGTPGLIILVGRDEVTAVEDFETTAT